MIINKRRKWSDYDEWKTTIKPDAEIKRFHLDEDFKKYILSKVNKRNSKTSISAISQWTDIKITFRLEDKDIEKVIENTVIKNEKITWEEIWNYIINKYKKL